jgi:hypothetical protein
LLLHRESSDSRANALSKHFITFAHHHIKVPMDIGKQFVRGQRPPFFSPLGLIHPKSLSGQTMLPKRPTDGASTDSIFAGRLLRFFLPASLSGCKVTSSRFLP